MSSLGIDVGGTSVKLAVTDGHATVWTSQSAFYTRPDTEQLIGAIRGAVTHSLDLVQSIGLCAPGRRETGKREISLSVNVPGLMGISLDDLIARALNRPVPNLQIVNDAVATATDVIEAKGLTGRVLSIAIGTGVGMGVLDDGVPLIVEGVSPGHIGQLDVSLDDNPPIGPDNGAGSLEGYIGVPALRASYGSVQQFLQNATVDDAPLRALGRAIRICHAIYRPRYVVLVGGVGTRLKRQCAALKQRIDIGLTSVANPDWSLLCGDHDFHAALGAAKLAAAVAKTDD